MTNQLQDYSYQYPEDLVALFPTSERSQSRLMMLGRKAQSIQHKKFEDLVELLSPGDLLVLNDSKVFPCRLVTKRKSGGRQEILLLHGTKNLNSDEAVSLGGVSGRSLKQNPHFEHAEVWHVILNASHKVKAGDVFDFDGLRVTVLDEEPGERRVLLKYNGDLFERLSKIADMPLPPYIKRPNEKIDQERYQTVYAKHVGSNAAPTAGLHFTPELLMRLKERGVEITNVTLHVGTGTFLPVRVNDISQHVMHKEMFEIGQDACDTINRVKKAGKRVIAVGTTTTRVLESIAREGIPLSPQKGTTDIFIHPPYQFKIVDAMVTNFHQPESTLLMLVSAFAGREFILRSYQEAIQNKYRLFSYGDAMLIM